MKYDYNAPSTSNNTDIIGADGHINFFVELERQVCICFISRDIPYLRLVLQEKTIGGNKEHEEDKRKEKEAEEKKIGLLKYLGEGSTEFEKEKPWWLGKRKRDETTTSTTPAASTTLERPITVLKGGRSRGSCLLVHSCLIVLFVQNCQNF
jgi:hypothetical protein